MKLSAKDILLKEVGVRSKYPYMGSLKQIELPEEIEGESFEGTITLTKLDETILAEVKLEAKVILICDRCLTNFEKVLSIIFDREYNINRREQNDEELFVDKYGDIDLSEPVREEIILAIPMKNLCKDKCQGICQKCGQNLNEDECKCQINSKFKSQK
jgi:uncharacterized protein